MFKLLMIQPENREINRFRRLQFNNFSQITIPYLAAFVDENYFEITIIDEYCQRIPFNKVFDLVAITVNTPNAIHCYELSAKFRDSKRTKIVMGGSHATLLPQEVKEHCDYLLIGESEDIWKQFLEDFRNGNAKEVYESHNPPNLKNLPVPRWDLLKRRRMMKGAIFATRGCPYSCRYCNLKQIYHDCFRTRPVDEVFAEIKSMKSKFFVFWDDNFFADKEYAKALMRAIAPLKRKWAAQATLCDCDDGELLEIAKAAGCQYLFIGLESFSRKTLENAGKSINRVDNYKRVMDFIHSHGIMIQAGIVFGFDDDTKDVFDSTLTACEKLGIDGVTVSILTPFPKTPVYNQFKNENRIFSHDWSNYNGKTAVVFEPKNMTAEELFEGYMNFRRRFYSLGSFIKRMRVSRTNILLNFIINFGYRLGLL
ncbi:MAG: B12-binding domain-containing radical SAM protein [Defluviitaleaceae bacterium]|nr:B12-binding domain-containing radical SAM protein [Defluviitaleaceae bacterium]